MPDLEYCENCSDEFPPDELNRCPACWDRYCGPCMSEGDGYECRSCSRRECVECGRDAFREDLWSCSDCCEYFCSSCFGGGDDYCHNCSRDDDYCSGSVRDYGYRPIFMPKGNDGEPRFGVELEVGGNWSEITRAVHRVDDCEDHLYMKEDSSINGVEIVTHPMTLAYAREYPFKSLLKGLRDEGCRVTDGYGLHIHVGRDAFRDHLGKRVGRVPRRVGERRRPVPGPQVGKSQVHSMLWLMFLYRNDRELQKLARRQESRWGSFSKPRPGELKGKAQGDRNNGQRYQAINCQNEATFEMRFFKSTLKAQEFYAALELADASVRYTHGLNSMDVLRGKALGWGEFSKWCEKHNYRNLVAEINK